jgi:hypothetical protein
MDELELLHLPLAGGAPGGPEGQDEGPAAEVPQRHAPPGDIPEGEAGRRAVFLARQNLPPGMIPATVDHPARFRCQARPVRLQPAGPGRMPEREGGGVRLQRRIECRGQPDLQSGLLDGAGLLESPGVPHPRGRLADLSHVNAGHAAPFDRRDQDPFDLERRLPVSGGAVGLRQDRPEIVPILILEIVGDRPGLLDQRDPLARVFDAPVRRSIDQRLRNQQQIAAIQVRIPLPPPSGLGDPFPPRRPRDEILRLEPIRVTGHQIESVERRLGREIRVVAELVQERLVDRGGPHGVPLLLGRLQAGQARHPSLRQPGDRLFAPVFLALAPAQPVASLDERVVQVVVPPVFRDRLERLEFALDDGARGLPIVHVPDDAPVLRIGLVKLRMVPDKSVQNRPGLGEVPPVVGLQGTIVEREEFACRRPRFPGAGEQERRDSHEEPAMTHGSLRRAGRTRRREACHRSPWSARRSSLPSGPVRGPAASGS